MGGEEQREERRPRQSGFPKRTDTDTMPRDRGTISTAVIEVRGEGADRLRRICPPPLVVKLNQDVSQKNKGRRRQRSVAVANLKKGTGTLLTSVMKTTLGF
jgi:hypothetical protein